MVMLFVGGWRIGLNNRGAERHYHHLCMVLYTGGEQSQLPPPRVAEQSSTTPICKVSSRKVVTANPPPAVKSNLSRNRGLLYSPRMLQGQQRGEGVKDNPSPRRYPTYLFFTMGGNPVVVAPEGGWVKNSLGAPSLKWLEPNGSTDVLL